MSSTENQTTTTTEEDSLLPQVLIIRRPDFIFSLTDLLQPHFRLLDPTTAAAPDTPLASFLSDHARTVRAAVVVGYTPLINELLAALPCLELVVATSAGVDMIDLAECRRRGITVTNASVAFADDVADCAVGLVVDVMRRISASDRFVRSGFWPLKGDFPLAFKLGGKRIGIVGLGSIGLQVARRLAAFGCKIAYNSRNEKQSVQYPYYANIHDLALNSDVLVACCSLTKQTRHIINKDVMEALGKNGVIINVGRGALVDEKEMVKLLVRGEIGGAGLDVFENEPNVPGELFELDNVVLSPHRAALTADSLQGVKDLTLTNLKAFFSNQPLQSIVNLE